MGFVLGLYGPAGSGKDTIGDYLVSHHGWSGKLSFAGNLKEMCKAVFDLTDYDVYDQDGKMRLFRNPLEFSQTHLNGIMIWMSKTHRHHQVPHRALKTVKSRIGTRFDNPRRVLQFVGTEVCRELISTYHVDVVVSQVNKSPESKFVITDVRFPNEGNIIVDTMGGVVAKVIRQDNAAAQNIDRTHASETSMFEWGKFADTINNDREGLDALYEEIDRFLERNDLCQDVPKTVS